MKKLFKLTDKLPFGKYKGIELKIVIDTDYQYFKWANEKEIIGMRKDTLSYVYKIENSHKPKRIVNAELKQLLKSITDENKRIRKLKDEEECERRALRYEFFQAKLNHDIRNDKNYDNLK